MPESDSPVRHGGKPLTNTPPADAAPHLSVEGFDGPLDFLLEMVRRQQLDLGRLSIIELADQFVAALAVSAGRVRLERRADWLVMASELLRLRAQLLTPANARAAEEAALEASRRLGQLEELAAMRAAAAWLAARPQLGHAHLGRGRQQRSARPQGELLVALFEATLVMLEGRAGQGGEAGLPTYRPAVPDLWRVPDALARLTALLGARSGSLKLEQCLPAISAEAPDRAIRTRAALASTLVAGLELARDGTIAVEQQTSFGQIRFAAVELERGVAIEPVGPRAENERAGRARDGAR